MGRVGIRGMGSQGWGWGHKGDQRDGITGMRITGLGKVRITGMGLGAQGMGSEG